MLYIRLGLFIEKEWAEASSPGLAIKPPSTASFCAGFPEGSVAKLELAFCERHP